MIDIYRDIEDFPKDFPAVITVGMFDGVHLAHRAIIDEMKQCAERLDTKTVLITFTPHPCKVLAPERYGVDLRILTTFTEKKALLEQAGLDAVIEIPFTKAFAALSPHEFLEMLLENMQIKAMVVGYNHNFGSNRMGDFAMLDQMSRDHHFEVRKMQELIISGETVSSTRIRRLLKEGEIVIANQLLYLPYTVDGEWKDNVFMPDDEDKQLPAQGTYHVQVIAGQQKEKALCVIDENLIILEGLPKTFEPQDVRIVFIENPD